MINILESLTTLAQYRPLFHSEADFQHALAWLIHQQLPRSQVRLERPHQGNNGTIYFDLWISFGEVSLVIELKYKTRLLSLVVAQEQYNLSDQSAQDCGRYDFLKDIQRLEQITMARPDLTGYAILLTNDSAYWTPARSSQTVDAAFRLNHGRSISGRLEWGKGASVGTTYRRESPIELIHNYQIAWDNYSHVLASKHNEFRCVVVKVTGINPIC